MAEFAVSETLRRAIRHHQAGRLREAEILYREILARHSSCVDALHYLGVIAHQVGHPEVAVEQIRQAAALAPANATIHSNLGEAYRCLGRLDEAVACFRQAVALQPGYADALNNLGNALTAQGQAEAAVARFRQAVALQPDSAHFYFNLGVALTGQQQFAQAMACFQQVVTLRADFVEAHNNLGNLFKTSGRLDEAVACFRRALALQPNFADAHYNLGVALADQAQIGAASACFERAIALKPDFAGAHNHLGNLCQHRGQLADASAHFRRALSLQPNFTEAHCNLGTVLQLQGHLDDAVTHFQQALAQAPNLPEARHNLGILFKDRGQLDDALACFQQALATKPDFADSHNSIGNVFKEQGRLDAALAAYRQALALAPARADIHSNLAAALNYRFDEAAIVETELRRWHDQHAQPLARFIAPHANDRAPDRRLRLGYVSPDFGQHAVGLNLLPLFQAHDHERFDIFGYADVRTPDRLTAVFRAHSDHWREVAPLTDAELAARIRQDRIDLLVDLTLHTAHNRLPVFARKPAPVQVSFAGYPGRTGLAAIDYHLTDPYLAPPGSGDHRGPDAPFHLPDTFWCYDPQASHLAVTPLPALTNGHLTFGCLNNFCKVNPAVLQLWARVLLAVPQSRLLLLSAEGSHRQGVLDVLAAAGLGADRVGFVSRQPRDNYLALYQRIDLGLDTFPYNGHTTSLDSYWMGVPVVTLVGRTSVGRAGWSQLSNLGLTELAAHSEDEFVAIASSLAHDLPRLAALRASLRDRMQRSPLMDGPRFARAIEAAYRTLWHRWCDQPAALSGAPS